MTNLPALIDPSSHYLQPGYSVKVPRGFTKQRDDLARMCEEWLPEAVATLVYWMYCDDPRASIRAAEILMERARGRAKEFIELSTAEPKEQELTLDQKAAALLVAMDNGPRTIDLDEEGRPIEDYEELLG